MKAPQVTALFVVLLAALTPAVAANAAIVTATYEGVFTEGTAQQGIFGSVYGDLRGIRYTARYTIDDSVPAISAITPGSTYIYGGTYFGFPKSPVSATMTVGGVSIDISGEYTGSAFASTLLDYHISSANHSSEDRSAGPNGDIYLSLYNFIESQNNDFTASSSISTALYYLAEESDRTFGRFEYLTPFAQAYGILSPESVRVEVAAVPEPATWALMIGGFGLAGVALRRRRTAVICKG